MGIDCVSGYRKPEVLRKEILSFSSLYIWHQTRDRSWEFSTYLTMYDSGSPQMSDDPSIHSYWNIFKNCLALCAREQNLQLVGFTVRHSFKLEMKPKFQHLEASSDHSLSPEWKGLIPESGIERNSEMEKVSTTGNMETSQEVNVPKFSVANLHLNLPDFNQVPHPHPPSRPNIPRYRAFDFINSKNKPNFCDTYYFQILSHNRFLGNKSSDFLYISFACPWYSQLN